MSNTKSNNKLLWMADDALIKNSNIKKFSKKIEQNYQIKFKNSFKDLYDWSIKNLESFLYTKGIPEPDILIRTGDTKRLSNFLLWQISYSEIFFEKKLWPDFSPKDFNKIILKYSNIKRNYGSLT